MALRARHAAAAAALLCAALSPAFAEQVAMISDATIVSDIKYLLYTPDGYEDGDEAWPLVVWLHGGGQSGADIEAVRAAGLPKMVEEGQDFPFLIFSPQNPNEELLFPIERVKSALDGVLAEHRVDPARVYVVGYSRGAFAAWAMAEQYPETFAAVVPIAGGGNRHYLNRTNPGAAFWAFHGGDDETIPLSDSVIMFQRLKELERDARLTVAEGVDHEGIETTALGDPELLDWLMAQKLEPAEEEPSQ